MNLLTEDDVRALMLKMLVERSDCRNIDAIVSRAVTAALISFGFEEEDRRDLRADLGQLRRWRKNVEQAQGYALKTLMTLIVTGVVGAVWFGVKMIVTR